MSGVIGRSFYIDVGEEGTEKPIKFLVVDPECETVRNAAGRGQWPTCGLLFLKDLFRNKSVEQVLITPTDPVKLVIVYSTYPSFKKQPLRFPKWQFNEFRYKVWPQRPRRAKSTGRKKVSDVMINGRRLTVTQVNFGDSILKQSIRNYVPSEFSLSSWVMEIRPARMMYGVGDHHVDIVFWTNSPVYITRFDMPIDEFWIFMMKYEDKPEKTKWKKEGF